MINELTDRMLGITPNKRLRTLAIQLFFKDRQIPKSLISERETAADAERSTCTLHLHQLEHSHYIVVQSEIRTNLVICS